MAQTGYTPILIYSSSTGGNSPSAGDLTNSTLGSELAINITDGKLFYKDNANAVQVIGWKTVPTSAGGTGLTSYTAGDMLYYASGTVLTKLAIGSTGRYLSSTGTAPQWSAPAALTKTDDTNVTLTLGGSASTALLNAASLTLGWTGQLAISRGGTGLSAFGTGVQTALGQNVTGSGGIVLSTSPQFINGAEIYTSGATGNATIKYYNSTKNWYVGLRGDTSNVWSIADDTAFRLSVYPSGGVAIGVTSDPGANSLQVNTATWSGPPNSPNIWSPAVAIGNSTNWIQAYQTGFYFNTAFYVVNTTPTGVYMNSGASAWSAYSDARLKTVTGKYDSALNEIDKLEPVKFIWNWDETKKQCVGLLAQSVEKVVPEAIDYSKLQNTEDETEYMTVRYTELIPILIASIQELKAKLKAAGVAGF